MKNLSIKGLTLIKENENLEIVFNNICKMIPASIFTKTDYNFFYNLVQNEIIDVFTIKKQKKIASIITVVDFKNYSKLKRELYFYFLKNPFKILTNFTYLVKSFLKGSNSNFKSDYLHLLHLVIYKKYFKKFTLRTKDNIFNVFFKKILNVFNAKIFFLCYEKENSKANNFYMRNKFKVYDRKSNIIFVKKKIG